MGEILDICCQNPDSLLFRKWEQLVFEEIVFPDINMCRIYVLRGTLVCDHLYTLYLKGLILNNLLSFTHKLISYQSLHCDNDIILWSRIISI